MHRAEQRAHLPADLANVLKRRYPLLDLYHFFFSSRLLVSIASTNNSPSASGNRNGFKDIATVSENSVNLLKV